MTRITTIHGVRTQIDREWQEAIGAAGPDTPNHYNIRKVGSLYSPTGTGEVEEDMILLNYPGGGGSIEKALAWAEQKGLKANDPRRVFALAEQHPKLPSILRCNPMYLVPPVECTFEGDRLACCVWWRGSERRAGLSWVGFFGCSRAWFAFRK